MQNDALNHILITVGVLAGLLIVAPGLIWLERRMLALWQDRYGPNRAGPFGVMVVLADTLKLFFKEDWVPPFADKKGICYSACHCSDLGAAELCCYSLCARPRSWPT